MYCISLTSTMINHVFRNIGYIRRNLIVSSHIGLVVMLTSNVSHKSHLSLKECKKQCMVCFFFQLNSASECEVT